ncbi:uncharacterized protein LOC113380860 [Ctenocephalides felis]|uniref:uncharacterized protein LOC113380860 n=1 Tax=Ctenocephalides felis TaxID=7515 RepID=UPI000E6E3676|nr:uncharacterized protein LOC113380860 [Ctenocephalides felis]
MVKIKHKIDPASLKKKNLIRIYLSMLANKSSIEHYMWSHKIHVAGLSETWLKEGHKYFVKGYRIFREDRVDGYGGTAILVKDNILCEKINHPFQCHLIQMCAVILKLENPVCIISIYCAPNSKEYFKNIKDLIETISMPILIIGDLNCKNLAWGSNSIDRGGEILYNIIEDLNLTIMNDGRPTTISTASRKGTPIDLTFCSNNLYDKIQWDIYAGSLGSDHLPINITLKTNFDGKDYIYPSRKWNTKEANWNNYAWEIEDKLKKVVLHEDHKSKYDAIIEIINEAAGKHFKERKTVAIKQFKPAIWWDEECENQIRNSSKPRVASSFFEDMLKMFVPDLVSNEINLNFANNLERDPDDLNSPIRLYEFDNILKNKKDSVPGMDNISYIMLKKSPIALKCLIIEVFNSILSTCWIPEDWKKIIIIPILKPNKDPLSIESYRPISLLSCLNKTFEAIVKNRLEWYLENKSLFNHNQFGFRRDQGTSDLLSTLSNDIHISNSNNRYVLLLATDIHKAYDNVDHSILLNRLKKLNIPHNIIKVIILLLTNRLFYVKYKNKLIGPRVALTGLPQGSILSPLLFNIYMSDFSAGTQDDVRKLQYADDLFLYISCNSLEECIHKIKRSNTGVSEWMRSNHLNLSLIKTKGILFTRHRKFLYPQEINMGNWNCKIDDSLKILGVIFDKKMTFRAHVEEVVKKCEVGKNIIRRLVGTDWGAHPSACLAIYKSIIRSHIDYGYIIYGGISTNIQGMLDKAQLSALRLCLGTIRSTPRIAVLAEAGEAPLNIRKQILTNRFLIKKFNSDSARILKQLEELAVLHFRANYWKNRPTPPLITGFYNLKPLEDLIITNDKLPYHSHSWKYSFTKKYIGLNDFNYTTHNSNKNIINWEFDNWLDTEWKDFTVIYTDCSKLGNKVGCAVYAPNRDKHLQFNLLGFASVFSAELTGITAALDFVIQEKISKTIILTDSKSALLALNHPKQNCNFLIFDTIHKIESILANKYEFKLVWIKGHSNIRGNEYVDGLAKEACLSVFPSRKAPATDLKSWVRKQGLRLWQNEYDMEDRKGTLFKFCKPKVSFSTWFAKSRMLKNFGTDRICIDGSHGTNGYGYRLQTLLVVDEFGSGIPVAFCFSNRQDELMCKIYFKDIYKVLGILETKVFITEDAPAHFNAWSSVMGVPQHKHLCS